MIPDLLLATDALVRSVGTNHATPYALLLGAGASVSSGVPSAEQCIWHWKRDILISNNPGLESHFTEPSLTSVRERIQDWLDAEGRYPPLGAKGEYEHYAEQALPMAEDRRRFFEQLVEKAIPSTGYHLLGPLAQSGVVKSIWTTNFDGLVSRAGALTGTTVFEVGLDSSSRVAGPSRDRALRQISLHGDYRYDALKNTAEELRTQDRSLQKALVGSLRHESLIVVGYSGRDTSVMDTLNEAYSVRGSGRLFWCVYGDEPPSAQVEELVMQARGVGREAYVVRIDGFDDLIHRISRFALEGKPFEQAKIIISSVASEHKISAPFQVAGSRISAILKSNAFLVELPGELLQLNASGYDTQGAWRRLKERVQGQDIVAGLVKGKILAIGLVDDVRRVFEDQLQGRIVRTPMPEWELSGNTVVQSLLTQALVSSISATRSFGTDHRALLWFTDPSASWQLGDSIYRYNNAALIGLRCYDGRRYMLVKPTIRVVDQAGERAQLPAEREVKQQVLGKQWNSQFNSALNVWREAIFERHEDAEFEFPPGSGSRFTFRVRHVPEAGRILGAHGVGPERLGSSLNRLVTQQGTEYTEPDLVFSSRLGSSRVRDAHPIRGLVNNRPYDFCLTASGLNRSTRIGIVSPSSDVHRVSDFLANLHLRADPQTKREYLLTYPGFTAAFGTSLDLPQPGMSGWVHCREPRPETGVREGALAIRRELRRRVDQLQSTYDPHCVLIYVPSRWTPWERYELEGERFDLHDFLKAYCIERGVASQFLREQTMNKRQRTEILWWLALSFYVKSRRTPWILNDLDKDTAFVGLGFSIDPTAPKGKHVLLGCSHIYNAEGLGLSFRLSKLDHSSMRYKKNPFLGHEDARRMGDNTRELFFDAHGKLPRRVVIHKRTPFRADEREGLIEGLSGVDHIEMVEINVDSMLRYVASRQSGQSFDAAAFPVRRGSAMVLETDQALLWVHGSADPVRGKGNPYYQGKSRIPAPLVLRRHYGQSSLQQLCREILGLSKMNWNTFDLYTKLPATVESSNAIARIGALLERFGPRSYDYRLFI